MLDLIPAFAAILPHRAAPYIWLMLAGFAIGISGHLFRIRWLVAAGVILIFLAVFLFPLAINLTQTKPPHPNYPSS